jgi:hypothetical protein
MSSIAENSALAADGLVMSQAALPHEVCDPPRLYQDPVGLNHRALRHLRSPQPFHENRDREKEFVTKWKPFHDCLDAGWHDVHREHLAAEEILERINDENGGGYFEDPERHHGQAVSDEKLHKRCHH